MDAILNTTRRNLDFFLFNKNMLLDWRLNLLDVLITLYNCLYNFSKRELIYLAHTYKYKQRESKKLRINIDTW